MGHDRSGWSLRGDDVDTVLAVPAAERVIARRYRLEQQVGAGGMGEVYRARDLELGEVVAIKVLKRVSPGQIELLRREVLLARRVTHEHVVRVHDLGIADGDVVYLTMEYVDGSNLSELLRTAAPPPAEAAELAYQICAGLEAAHRAGVVHGDLKPSNVLVRRTDGGVRALLSDFGISRPISEPESGVVAGTPAYAAPEQWTGGQLGPWSDCFALGALIYELFTGQRLLRVRSDAERDLAARVRELPARLADVVLELVELDAKRRAVSVARASRVLAELAGRAVERDTTTLRLAVMPFRLLGGAADDHLGAGLADELARVLSSNRGLVVMNATADATSDPRAAGTGLGVTAVVHGTVQRAGDRVRVGVELAAVDDGRSLWSDRLDGTIEDVFAFEDAMARRICEALRIGWLGLREVGRAPREALELYFRARRQLRHHVLVGPDGAVALLEHVLALAPEFEPAIAMHANACAKAWFVPSAGAERDWAAAAREAVAVALDRAPALAESHVAAGMVAAQDGDYAAAVRALDRALALAPTSADAHNYLGRVQAEGGRTDDALWHLAQATELDPTLLDPALYVARVHALRGDRSHAEILWTRQGYARAMALTVLLRIAIWYGDTEEVQRCLTALRQIHALRQDAALVLLFGSYVLGELEPAAFDEVFDHVVPTRTMSARVRSNTHQIMIEGHLARGARDRALRHLTAAARLAMVDLDWLERCPLLAPVRGTPELEAAEQLVRERARAVWIA